MSALKGATAPIYFGSFIVTPQVFHTTPPNLRLGHVLVSPRRVVPRVTDLTPAETSDLFLTVRRVGRMVERVYGATSLNIAIQDGAHAGQSVPHVHAHIIPRKAADLDHAGGMDAIYDLLDGDEGDLGKAFKNAVSTEEGWEWKYCEFGRRSRFPVVDNDARKPRDEEDMRTEAEMLAREMENEPLD
ncbi:hypothetical protein N7497_011003 [Penicillium chrysogenum]|nr:hypothetical protein N7497_011003 [Penicillium chrysogenum]